MEQIEENQNETSLAPNQSDSKIDVLSVLKQNVELIDIAVERGSFRGSEIMSVAQIRQLNIAFIEKLESEENK